MLKHTLTQSLSTYDAGQSCVFHLLGFLCETESLQQDEMPHKKSVLYCGNVDCTQPVVPSFFLEVTKQRKSGLKEKVRRKDRRRDRQRVVNRC